MTEPLPAPLSPRPGESATSFIEGLAEANGLGFLALSRTISNQVVDSWTDREWEILARFSGEDVTAFDRIRRRPPGTPSGVDSVLGNAVRPTYLVRRTQRICPLCVAADGLLKAVWDVAHAAACPLHGTILVSSCTCGRDLRDHSRGPKPRSCFCKRLYATMEAAVASTDLATGAEWIHAAMGASAPTDREWNFAPPPFDGLGLGDLILVMELVGRAATATQENDPVQQVRPHGYKLGSLGWNVSIARNVEIVEAAVPVMRDWPAAFNRILDGFAARNEAGRSMPRRFRDRGLPARVLSSTVGRSLVRPWRGMDGKPLRIVASTVDDWCRARLRAPRKLASPITRKTAGSQEMKHRVASFTGDDPESLRFKRNYHRAIGALRPDLTDKADVERLLVGIMAPTLDVRDTLDLLDHRTLHAFEHWLHPDLLVPVPGSDPNVRSSVRFYRADVQALRTRLCNAIVDIGAEPMPADLVALNTNGISFYAEWYTKTDLILDILSGRVAAFGRGRAPLLVDCHVDRRAADEASLSRKVRMLLHRNDFYPRHRLLKLLVELWPNAEPIAMDGAARTEGRPAFREVRNTTGGRDRPAYRFGTISVLQAQLAAAGRSVSPEVDAAIRAHAIATADTFL
ncbi:TniQ family protein [Sphingomonas sp. A2-49]|uniref:TniQ family protein n=1 Tax=Sphingomonas sp. A2-49 TaxID=1391375 RepID=UPI0021D289AD|nr:TniQ family protein [Sphingomonas sp. A2-49]MCU6455436.1 TniQ family protein [Sphingomonas sp. A2-49]